MPHIFEVLSDTGTTNILGSDLLKKFQSTEFDWGTDRVRLGNIWTNSQAAVEGGDPLSTAEVARCEDIYLTSTIVKSDLERCQREKLNKFFEEFSCVFAGDPKKPDITSMTKHKIDTLIK